MEDDDASVNKTKLLDADTHLAQRRAHFIDIARMSPEAVVNPCDARA
jgi:hypothetical protein